METKLKTLKDLGLCCMEQKREDKCLHAEELIKAEAIKWVKRCKRKSPNTWGARTRDFREFFNITEEDLA